MRIAVYQPDIAQNCASILRLGACLGVPVDIIEPCGFLFSDAQLRRAGMDYLEKAEFVRLGSIHRNTFIRSPGILSVHLNFLQYPHLFLAGQISGVEGYVESAAMGLLAGINAAHQAASRPLVTPPRETALGALINHLTNTATKDFQPMNVNFGLFSPLEGRIPKKLRGAAYAERALQALEAWINQELAES